MFGLNEKELGILKEINTPSKIQDFLEDLEINFERNGDTCMSPKKVLEMNRAHCIEGAIFAAAALRVNGFPPLVLDLTANKKDYDHVIAVFKKNDCWGAISKSNILVRLFRVVATYSPANYFARDFHKLLRQEI